MKNWQSGCKYFVTINRTITEIHVCWGGKEKRSARHSEEEVTRNTSTTFPSLDHQCSLQSVCVFPLSFSECACVCGCVTVCLCVFYYCIQGKETVSKFPSSSSSSSFSSSFFGAAISWTEARKLCVGQLSWEAQRIVGRAGTGWGTLYIDTSIQRHLS